MLAQAAQAYGFADEDAPADQGPDGGGQIHPDISRQWTHHEHQAQYNLEQAQQEAGPRSLPDQVRLFFEAAKDVQQAG